MVEVLQIETPTLGDRSYMVHDGESALVIDPQRDIDRVIALAGDAGVRVTHVAETHVHNDYITGGFALARAAGAAYLVNADDPVSFDRTPVSDGELVQIGGGLRVRVLATPGHTYHHLTYAVEADGGVAGVFTGGSLLYGSTGRTDLLGTDAAEALSRAQWASAHRLARELPDTAPIFPTHGFGSFCAATQSQATSSTIGKEKLVNPALTLDEQAYVESLLAGLDAWPAYYAHMAPANLAGPAGPDLSPPRPADAAELHRRIAAGEWVVDLRDRIAFAAGYLPGAFSFPLDGSFASYLGWMIPWGTPLTLLGESPHQVAEAQRELVRIGIDRPAAAATGRPETWAGEGGTASLRLVKFGDLATALADGGGRRPVVLDVRRRLEWDESHIAGAVHIPLHELPGRIDELPERLDERAERPERAERADERPGSPAEPPVQRAELPPGEVWVHCGAGYRSMVAASMLAARGRRVVAVNDDFVNAEAAGLPLERS
jgi:glyoxylase-like metal-dependent hydrolase (beta-lactamase superfamily II)/rhodanese-related sulfurtransferase